MISYENKGYTIDIRLPERFGYREYTAECTYKYDKDKDKYLLSMWLKRDDIDDKFKIDSQEIDTQYISGTKETIKHNICKIVEQMCIGKFFDYYIERYEYTYKCFDKGSEFIQN